MPTNTIVMKREMEFLTLTTITLALFVTYNSVITNIVMIQHGTQSGLISFFSNNLHS